MQVKTRVWVGGGRSDHTHKNKHVKRLASRRRSFKVFSKNKKGKRTCPEGRKLRIQNKG